MHGTHEDSAQSNPQKGHGAETGTHNGTEDGAYTRNVEKLNKEGAPARHGDIINPVVERSRGDRCLLVNLANTVEIGSIEEVGSNECNKTN